MANEIAKLFVALGLEDKEFIRGVKSVEKSLTSIAKPMAVLGAAITAEMGFAVKAAEEERLSIAQLSAVMSNAQNVFGDSAQAIEELIKAQQRQTGVTDDEQRQAMSSLIVTTNDFRKSMELLPLVLDLAAAKQMDVVTAAELVGKVAEGNTGILGRYGIQLQAGATSAQALAELQERVGGSAAAMASPFEILKGTLENLQETIGGAVLPSITKMAEKLIIIIENVTEWIGKNPELVEGIARWGGALLIIGGTILGLVKVIQAVTVALAVMQALSGPAGWATLAAGIVIAGGAILGLNAIFNDLNAPELPTPHPGIGPPHQIQMASGGIVTRPTMAMIGEAGPEAVIPLGNRGGGGMGGNTYNFSFPNYVGDKSDLISLVRDGLLELKASNVSLGLS